MHFYSLSFPEVMALQMRMFWLMNECIDRIKAQNDKRSLHIAALSAMDGKRVMEIAQVLDAETGQVIKTKFDPIRTAVRDTAGIAQLKALAGHQAGARIKG